ncbi:MAG: selenium metabolism-associated LysR family transcriptional regulator [Bacillota bacterium]
MNLNWLKTFVIVAETSSFSRTARELNLTQPAVSKHIAALESLYGITLIDRSRRTVTLTEAGTALLPLAVETLAIIAKAAREMDALNKTIKGALIIGASTIPGEYLLPKIIRRFQKFYPQIGISLEIADTGVILRRVLEGNLYLGAVGAFKPTPGLEAIAFADDELVLIIPVDHPLARQKVISTADLVNREVVWRESDSGTRFVIEEKLRSIDINPENLRIVAEMGSTEAVLSSVEAGMGLSFVSRWAAEAHQKNGRLVMSRIKGLSLNRTLYLIYAKGRFLSRPVTAFIDFIIKQPELFAKDL